MISKLNSLYCSYVLIIVLGRSEGSITMTVYFVGSWGAEKPHLSTSLEQALNSLHILKFNWLGGLKHNIC